MVIEEINNIKTEKKELRKFGITIGIALCLWGAVFFWRDKDYYSYFFILSAVFLFLGLVLPPLLKPVYKIWIIFARYMNWFITRIILVVLLYFIFTPIGFIAKLFGKDFLDLKFREKSSTYWILKDKIGREKRDYEKQF